MIKNKLHLFVYLAVFLLATAMYTLTGDPQAISVQSVYLFITISSVFAGIYAIHNYGVDHGIGKALMYLTIGLFSWAFAEILWYVFNFYLNIDPYPSIADFFFLAAYPIFLIGIHFARKSAGISFSVLPKSIKYSIYSAFVILAAITAYYSIYYVYDASIDTIQNVFSIVYIVADLILLQASILIMVIVREFKKGKLGTFWSLMLVGFLFFFIADILFGVYEPSYTEGIKPYVYIDLLWLAGYATIAYAYVDNALFMKSIRDRIKAGV